MRAVLMVLCVVVVLTPYVDAMMYGHGKKDTLPAAARDEISRLVETLEFYNSMKMGGVTDDAEVADARRQMMKRRL